MEFFLRTDINIITMILLIVVLRIAYKSLDKTDKINQTFLTSSLLVVLELFIEILDCAIDGGKGSFFRNLSYFSHMILFITAPVLTYFWFSFIKNLVIPNKKVILHRSIFLSLPILINFVLTVASLNNGNVFYLDSDNIYHRGSYFIISALITYFYFVLSFWWIYIHRKKIQNHEFLPILIFGVSPVIGGIIQWLFYETLLMWSSYAFSLTVVYIFLQKRMAHLDCLTGVWTRESFLGYFHQRVEGYYKEIPMIFADMDGLKVINDKYGHGEGDFAIKKAVHIIKSNLRKTDIISRYGGDEFLIVIDIEKTKNIERILDRINKSFDKYNSLSGKEYRLGVTFGYGTYNKEYENLENFVNIIDSRMYDNKRKKREVSWI